MVEYCKYTPDILQECLANWLILGMQTGMRLSEWYQERSVYTNTAQDAKIVDGTPKAFIFTDFKFSGNHNVRQNNGHNEHVNIAKNVIVLRHFQKNNDNKQKLMFKAI